MKSIIQKRLNPRENPIPRQAIFKSVGHVKYEGQVRCMFQIFLGGVAGSKDFACATLPTTPLIFKAKFKIFVTLPF